MTLTAARPEPAVATRQPRSLQLAVAVIPAALYLAVRGTGTLILWGMSAIHGQGLDLRPWDADWYLRIAELGYAGAGEDMVDANGNPSPDGAMAFFPGYPLLVRGVTLIIGHHYLVAGLIVSTLAGIAGAYGVARLARLFGGRRRGELLAVALMAAAPMSVVYTLPYPEALLVALCAWTLVAVLEHRWWPGAPLVVAAGCVSPLAAPLIPVVIGAATIDVYRERAFWDAAVTALAAPLGMLGYLLWVHETSDVPGGYFQITSAGWGNHVDFGVTTSKWIFQAFTRDTDAFVVATASAIIAAAVGLAASWRRMPWQVWIYTAATLALIVGHSGLVQDRVRLLLSVFPLLIVAALRLERVRLRTGVLATAAAGLAGLWFGAYALTVWQYAI